MGKHDCSDGETKTCHKERTMYDSNEQTKYQTSINRQWLSDLLQKHENSTLTFQSPTKSNTFEQDPILRHKALVVAPMVEQSDLPFRLICRKYGANLAFTPMIHARYFVVKQSYRKKMWKNVVPTKTRSVDEDHTCSIMDRPLVAQLCGNNKEILLQAAKLLENQVDAIDLNCGCPTQTAKRGRYGAFLLPSNEYLVDIIRYLAENLSCPVTAKVRLLTGQDKKIDIDKSLTLFDKLVDAGVSLLTVHGRTRFQKGEETGSADWESIRKVVDRVGKRIPVIANGNIKTFDDVRRCLAKTGADGVMSSESILEYPPLFTETQTEAVNFTRIGPSRLQIAREYLSFCQIYPPEQGGGGSGMQCIRMHLDVFLHEDWKQHPNLRESLLQANAFKNLYDIIKELENVHLQKGHEVEDERLSWYMRHR